MRPVPTATLLAIGGDGRALQISRVRNSDSNLLVGDQVFELQLGALVQNLRAALIAVIFLDGFEFLDDNAAQFFLAGQNRFILGNAVANFFQLVQQFVNGKLCQAIELQFENRINLAIAQDERGHGGLR